MDATDAYPACWPQIGDIVVNHGADAPDSCEDLIGCRFEFAVDGTVTVFEFHPGRLRTVRDCVSDDRPAEVFRVREGIYLVDLPNQTAGRFSMHVVDVPRGRLLTIEMLIPAPGVPDGLMDRIARRGSQSAVDVIIRQAQSDPELEPPFPASRLLLGKQFRFTYSETHVYDHFYLSDRYYAWFCRAGPDVGLGDVEESEHLLIDEDLVLFVWKEKLLPCVGVTIEDHRAGRSLGKILGADSQDGSTAGVIVGARIEFVADIAGEWGDAG